MHTFKQARILPRLTLLLLLIGTTAKPAAYPRTTEILWDDWGVPHIFAKNTEELFRAFGWAQMQSHGNLLLRLYGQARGRAAEYWGQRYLESDKWVRSMGVPERARQWSEAQSPSFRKNLDAFAAGINQYASKHPECISEEVKIVLPVNAVDVMAHAQRVVNFTFVVEPETVMSSKKRWEAKGSSAWAIAPARSASGHAMLLANPHLPWAEQFLFYQSQLVAPGVNIDGATLVGFPVLTIAFNDYLGWAHTVNTYDGEDTYELALAEGGYRWNGKVEAFEKEDQTIKVKQPDGTFREEKFAVKRSIHGPVIAEKADKAIALRVAGLDRSGLLEQWWEMGKARSLAEFEQALKRMQLPIFNVIYADRNGHIMYLFDGSIPVRPGGDWNYWSGLVPGDSSATLWMKTLPYSDLPKIIDPPSHWLQNSNDPPWTTTLPPVLNRDKYPPYLTPNFTDFRAQRSIRMLSENKRLSLEEMIKDKYSTRMELADRILDDLISAARNSRSQLAQEAADVLAKWDHCAEADSRGAMLFMFWAQQMGLIDGLGTGVFATAWDEKQCLTTPDGLANPERAVAMLETAANKVKAAYGALDVPWGKVARLRYGKVDLPGNGAPGPLGTSRVIWFIPAKDGNLRSVGGDSFIMAVEFSTPPKARALLAYGNSSQPGSPHNGDQFEMFAKKELRPIWHTRAEIDAHLKSRDTLE